MSIEVIEIPAGEYVVGDDGLPTASPRHRRRVDAPFWIDAWPVSVATFSAFVADAGYRRAALWRPPLDRAADDPRWASVDSRCEAVRAASPGLDPGRAALGLTWFEAAAVARAAGGRLPYEVEWEVAAGGQAGGRQIGRRAGVSEWVADAFAPQYWRADHARRGVAWPTPVAGTPVTVRGTGPGEIVSNVAARRGRPPEAADAHRGFRRAWDVPPPAAVVRRT